MTRAHAVGETGVWSVAGRPISVEYPLPVIDEIRAAAVAGYCRFPRGGIEVGGILFGSHEGGAVRILEARPVEIEYALGPSFVLSERDHARFAEALSAGAADTGLEPVGWYHSHTRSDVCLSAQDKETHHRYFGKTWQVALVLRPEPFGTARAAFFTRGADGELPAEDPEGEFAITVGSSKVRTMPAAGQQQAPLVMKAAFAPGNAAVGVVTVEPEAAEAAPPEAAPAAITELAERPGRFRWVAAVLAAVALSLAVWAGARWWWNSRQPEPLALRVLDNGGQLQISWDRDAPPVRQAKSGTLEIQDGANRIVLPFDHERLLEGSVTYARHSETVEVRLSVDRGGRPQAEEFVRFLGKPIALPPAAAALPPSAAAPVIKVESPAQAEPPPVAETREPPVRGVEEKETRADLRKSRNEAPAPAAATAASPRQFNIARLETHRSARQPVAVLAPPAISISGAIPANAPVASSAAQRLAPPPAPPLAHSPNPVSKPAYAGPSSGRIIWTGQLERGVVLSIDGSHASTGAVTGELPGVPVRVTAYPAELSGRGRVVFSANPRGRRDAAGPQNGWNETSYTYDPRRAASVIVTEAPGPQHGWKRVSVRADRQSIAVIIIDWRAAPE